MLDDKRLGKQRVECLQILNTLNKGPYQYRPTIIHQWESCSKEVFENNPQINVRKTPWYNHPAVKMWAGYESYLIKYGEDICDEWIRRGFKDNTKIKIASFNNIFKNTPAPEWLGFDKFHSSHRAALLSKNVDYYSKFGWTEPVLAATNYYWPK